MVKKISVYYALMFQLIYCLCTLISKLFWIRKKIKFQIVRKRKRKSWLIITLPMWLDACVYIFTVCIKFIKVLKWLNNCELIIAAKVIPRNQVAILESTSNLYHHWSSEKKLQLVLNKVATSLFFNQLNWVILVQIWVSIFVFFSN